MLAILMHMTTISSKNEAIQRLVDSVLIGGMQMEKITVSALPKKGVVFLGGHPNMTKKLQQKYPHWQFLSDDQLRKGKALNKEIVFYWTKHCSHKLMRYAYSKLPDTADIHYVTATNIVLLEQEMREGFHLIQRRKNIGA